MAIQEIIIVKMDVLIITFFMKIILVLLIVKNVLKDFIHMNRVMRRQQNMSSDDSGFEKIIIDGPVMKVEVVAMYK